MKRRIAERGGRRAEAIAALWLQLKGWRILARCAHPPVDEVDLIAKRGRTVSLVEVKARASEGEIAGQRRIRSSFGMSPPPKRSRPAMARRRRYPHRSRLRPRRLPRHLANVWHG